MEIGQILAVALMGTILSVMLKKQNPEIALMVAVITGILIFLFLCNQIGFLVQLLKDMAEKAGVGSGYFSIVLKVMGIAYLAQFGIQLCADAGENAIASKIELAGKVLIMMISAPVLVALLDTILGLTG